MVYDITDPANAKFANYINSREFDEVIKGDVSPEGLCFVPASDSKTGKALLLAACEVSGTMAVYTCDSDQGGIAPVPAPDNKDQADDSPASSPRTGDSSTMFLWIALLLVSAAGISGTAVYGKRRKR